MPDEPQKPADQTPGGTPPDQTPQDKPPEGQQPGQAAQPSPGAPDVEALKKVAEEYEKAKPVLEAYGTFDKILEQDKELASAVEGAIKAIAEKRKSGVQPQVAPQQTPPQDQPPQGPTTIELQNELRFRDYVGEFSRVAQANGIPPELAQEAFNGTVQEVLKINPDPLGRFDLSLVEKGFKAWNERVDNIVKIKNDIYTKSKRGDEIPAQGSGQAPRENEPQLYTTEDRRNFIEAGLRAAGNVH